MSPRARTRNDTGARLLAAWEPPPGAGEPVGVVASTFTFDASFFEEELLARFLSLETTATDGRAWLVERENRLGGSMACVLADRRHVSRSTTLAWDLLPVVVGRGACQHAKVVVLAWERHIRAIVGSANLSEPAYRRNLETFAALDFHAEGIVPQDILHDLLDFLGRMSDRVPDPRDEEGAETASPRMRLRTLLDTIRRLAARMDLPTDWPRGSAWADLVLLEPGRGEGVLDQMRTIWGKGPGPNEVRILSPFWPDPTDSAARTWVEEVERHMASRGERMLHLYAPGFADPTGDAWSIRLPEPLVEEARRTKRLTLRVRPVEERREDEFRPLHAKSIWWRRNRTDELLLIGSSNGSLCGLGIGAAARNFEANLCFSATRDRRKTRWIDECFPEAQELESAQCIDRSVDCGDEEGGPEPLPAFFRWACLSRGEDRSTLLVGLGGDGEPEEWSLTTCAGRVRLDRGAHARQGRADVWETVLPLDTTKEPPPTLIDVEWRRDGITHAGKMPVNALDAESRSRPELWLDIDLDTLLELLAAGGPIHRQLLKVLQRREAAGRARNAVELDPHRRVDTSRFLMQRIRRISRGLEGLYEKLAEPIHSEAALEFRLQGPLGPKNLARRLIAEAEDAAEQRFLVAEVTLVLGRAARTVEGLGLSTERVRERYLATADDLRSLLPGASGEIALDAYVEKAFERAVGGARA
jgi:hypothetical protein